MKNETDMKRTYKTPAMKVRNIRCSQMLCESLTSVGEVNRGNRYDGSLYDYIGGGKGSDGYETSSNPD